MATLPPTRREAYAIYLQSAHWHTLRRAVRVRSNLTCEACQDTTDRNVQAHHLFYGVNSNWLTVEPADLIALCRRCHEKAHADPSIGQRMARLPRGIERFKAIRVELCPDGPMSELIANASALTSRHPARARRMGYQRLNRLLKMATSPALRSWR